MRVNGPVPQFGVSPGKAKKADGQDGSFELPEETSSAQSRSGVRASHTSSMGALIAAQLHGVDEKEENERKRRRRRGVMRGQNILAALDELKIEMLAGRLSPTQILKLISSVEEREDSNDPRLEAILNEIELRARVELAKLQRKNSEQA